MESRCMGGRSSVNAEEKQACRAGFFFVVIVPTITKMNFEGQPSAALGDLAASPRSIRPRIAP